MPDLTVRRDRFDSSRPQLPSLVPRRLTLVRDAPVADGLLRRASPHTDEAHHHDDESDACGNQNERCGRRSAIASREVYDLSDSHRAHRDDEKDVE